MSWAGDAASARSVKSRSGGFNDRANDGGNDRGGFDRSITRRS